MPDELRVLRVLTRPNLGGPTRQCVALSRVWKRLGVRELCAVGSVGRGEAELELGESESFARVPHLAPRVNPIVDWRAGRELLRIARAFRPDIVHTHTAKAGWLGARIAQRLGVPLVHTYHGHVLRDYFPAPVQAVYRAIERRLNRRRDAVFCVSRSCGEELVELGVLRRGCWERVPPAVDFTPGGDRGSLRDRLGIAAGALAIAWCGRLVAIKDPALLVATMRGVLASEAGLEPHFAVFGGGPLQSVLDDALSDGLPLAWHRDRPDFPSLLAAFDVVLMTSRREGLPLVALEALAAGIPVVGPRVPGLLDLEGPGVRLAARDAGALAAALEGLPSVPAWRSAEIRERHDPTAVARQYFDSYVKLVEARR